MIKNLTLLTTAALAVSACSLGGASGGALERWTNYGSDSFGTAELTEKQALAVFYRTADFKGDALNIYINGDYHSSLRDKSYTALVVCANRQRISASYSISHQFGNREQGEHYVFPVKNIVFFRAATDSRGNPIFEQIEEKLAREELSRLNGKVQHTIPRSQDNVCQNVVLSHTSVSSGALWGIDRYAYADILSEGRQEIATFVEFVKSRNDIKHIEVRGYTDPEASEQYNLALSQRRADSVKQALQQAGISQPIFAKGYGETQLIVKHCAELQNNAERAACNQPNRRVEMTTYSK